MFEVLERLWIKLEHFLSHLEVWRGGFTDFSEIEDIYNAFMAVFCVVCAGLAAGLTMGLLSLDTTKLQIKILNGTSSEREAAAKVLPIVKQHHLLLVTLLLFNSLANETLPIFLGALVPNYVAVIISVVAILIFGEILPSALFTGPTQLYTAASLSKLVYFLLAVFYPVTMPISKLLDYAFGVEEHSNVITRGDMAAMIKMQQREDRPEYNNEEYDGDYDHGRHHHHHHNHHHHQKQKQKQNPEVQHYTAIPSSEPPSVTEVAATSGASKPHISTTFPTSSEHGSDIESVRSYHSSSDGEGDERGGRGGAHKHHSEAEGEGDGEGGALNRHEVMLMLGVLDLSKFTVADCMIDITEVYSISSKQRLDMAAMMEVLRSGFSRVPVYFKDKRRSMVGYMLVKELIVLNPADGVAVETQLLREPLYISPLVSLLDMLSIFQEGRCHMAMVCENPALALTLLRQNIEPYGGALVSGIVTLEDVLEKIMQNDILDETDRGKSSSSSNRLSRSDSADTHPTVYRGGGAPSMFYHGMGKKSEFNRAAGAAHRVRSYSNTGDNNSSYNNNGNSNSHGNSNSQRTATPPLATATSTRSRSSSRAHSVQYDASTFDGRSSSPTAAVAAAAAAVPRSSLHMQLPVPLSLQMVHHTLPAALEPLPRTPATRRMSHDYIHFTNMTTVMEDSSEGEHPTPLSSTSKPNGDDDSAITSSSSSSSRSQLLSRGVAGAPDYGSTI